MKPSFVVVGLFVIVLTVGLSAGCDSKPRHPFGKEVTTWEGQKGVLEIYAGDKLVKRFIEIEKMSTTIGATDGQARHIRHGFGVMDENFDLEANFGEEEVYFEISETATPFVFYQNPNN